MNIAELRALAAYHLQASVNAFSAAKGMGDCPAAEQFNRNGAQHAVWADGLSQLADAFQTIKSIQ